MAALRPSRLYSRRLRNEGTAIFNLIRNIGSSIGISVVQALFVSNTQVVPCLAGTAHHTGSDGAPCPRRPEGASAVAALNQAVTAQAAMVAYIDDFYLMLLLTLLALPAAAARAQTACAPAEPRMSH